MNQRFGRNRFDILTIIVTTPPKKHNVVYVKAGLRLIPAARKLVFDLKKISTNETKVITPAAKPRDDARTLRLASFTSHGMNTTAAPIPVEAPAPRTTSNAKPTLPFFSSADDAMVEFRILCAIKKSK